MKSFLSVRLQAVLGKDRRLVIDVPDVIPIGPVEVVVRLPQPEGLVDNPLREAVREQLKEAGLLVVDLDAPESGRRLSPEELLEAGQLPADALPSEDLIDGDRGEI